MIDKIELRLPSTVYFQREIRTLLRNVNYASGESSMQPSRDYAGVGDLRPFGVDALLHYRCKRGSNGNHKLEMLETGSKPYSAICAQISAVVDAAIDDLGIMRIDLCADLPDVPVSWFQPRVRVKYKRTSRTIGPLTADIIGNMGIETISAGKRPNMVRIYDKVAESKMQFRKMERKASKDADPLNFEREFGFSPNAVRTRIERQFGGGRIPAALGTFGLLPSAADFNPFEVLEISANTGCRLPTPKECESLTDYMAGIELNRRINAEGFQAVRRWLNAESRGNAARMLKRLSGFLPLSNGDSITVERIFETYRESVSRQLGS
jgi:hypothetical protein